MANLACLLKILPTGRQGRKFLVSGSDLDIFGPSAVLLKKHGINYYKNHNPSHIKKFKPDMVVIGNAMSRGNPSLEYILNKRVPYCSMPEIIKTELLFGRKPIVITGTSGKTTTTALLTWILHKTGLKPTALVGGIMNNFNSGFVSGNSRYVVVEGDEYNSSFYDASPKFMHYQPYIGLINNIQADHLDIYGNIENILSAFKKFVNIIPSSGSLILNKGNRYTPNLIKSSRAKVTTFGKGGNIEAKNIRYHENGLSFDVKNGSGPFLGNISTNLLGGHNVENILAAITVSLELKIPFKKINQAMASFKGVKRRLEIIHQKDNTIIIDDFAHNPDKVLASLSALRSHFPKHKIVAIFEPRTGSSRRKFFQDAYPLSFKPADVVYIAEPYKKHALDKKETFSSWQLVKDLNKQGTEAYTLKTADDILKSINKRLPSILAQPTIIIVMTSGDFDGIHQKLIDLFP